MNRKGIEQERSEYTENTQQPSPKFSCSAVAQVTSRDPNRLPRLTCTFTYWVYNEVQQKRVYDSKNHSVGNNIDIQTKEKDDNSIERKGN